MGRFGGRGISRVANGVCDSELPDNVGEGDVGMLVVEFVLLA